MQSATRKPITLNPSLHGVRPKAVLDLIGARADKRSAAPELRDGRKLALVIEGGAMRAVCSAGGAAALAYLGFTDLFDEVYATSAGAMNASYFLSHQPASGIRVYFDHCTSRLFMNPWRIWKVIDIDYLFERIVTVEKPLKVERVLSSPARLYVTVIDKDTGGGLLIDTQKTETPLLQVLKATTAIPVFYNRAVQIEDRRCIDGGLAIPFPIKEALDNGCTDVLVLLTRSADYQPSAPNSLNRQLFNLICARGRPGIRQTFALHHENLQAARELALGKTPVPPSVNIATICQDASEKVQRTTTNRDLLEAGALRYARKVLRLFGADASDWDFSKLADAPD